MIRVFISTLWWFPSESGSGTGEPTEITSVEVEEAVEIVTRFASVVSLVGGFRMF